AAWPEPAPAPEPALANRLDCSGSGGCACSADLSVAVGRSLMDAGALSAGGRGSGGGSVPGGAVASLDGETPGPWREPSGCTHTQAPGSPCREIPSGVFEMGLWRQIVGEFGWPFQAPLQ